MHKILAFKENIFWNVCSKFWSAPFIEKAYGGIRPVTKKAKKTYFKKIACKSCFFQIAI